MREPTKGEFYAAAMTLDELRDIANKTVNDDCLNLAELQKALAAAYDAGYHDAGYNPATDRYT